MGLVVLIKINKLNQINRICQQVKIDDSLSIPVKGMFLEKSVDEMSFFTTLSTKHPSRPNIHF